MLTIDKIKQSFDKAARRLDTRNKNFRKQLQQALEADENRKKLKTEYDRLASEANKQAKEIGQLYKAGKTDLAGEAKQKASELKELQKELNSLRKKVNEDETGNEDVPQKRLENEDDVRHWIDTLRSSNDS